jgi:hypothetical protein
LRVLIGHAFATLQGFGFGGSIPNGTTDSDDITVWNAEASGGLTSRFGRSAATLGYRIDAFWNLYGDFPDAPLNGGDRMTHGPFVKVTVDLTGSDNRAAESRFRPQ